MTAKKTATNKQRNEITVDLGDYKVKCKLTFAAIVQIEELFDATIFEIVHLLNAGKIKADKLADLIEIASVDELNREELEEAILETGSVNSLTAVVPLVLTAFAGNKTKAKSEDTKSDAGQTA